MNEAETRAERIDPALKASGWGVMQDTKVFREFHITHGKIQTGGTRSKPLIADYILSYKNVKLAVVEAKSDEVENWRRRCSGKGVCRETKTEVYLCNKRQKDIPNLYEDRGRRFGCNFSNT